MPAALIAIVVIALFGVGAYFFTNESARIEPTETEVARTETDVADQDTVTEPESTSGGEVTEDESESAADVEVGAELNTEASVDTSMPDDETASATPYESEQTYLTPARTSHEIDVNLTVAEDGTVVGANVVYDNGDGFSNGHQERFDGAFRDEVVGQNINDIELSRVGGASLTSEAFNDAVADIRAQVS